MTSNWFLYGYMWKAVLITIGRLKVCSTKSTLTWRTNRGTVDRATDRRQAGKVRRSYPFWCGRVEFAMAQCWPECRRREERCQWTAACVIDIDEGLARASRFDQWGSEGSSSDLWPRAPLASGQCTAQQAAFQSAKSGWAKGRCKYDSGCTMDYSTHTTCAGSV